MTLLTLAEWTGSAIVSNLIDAASFYLSECMLPAEREAELNRLKMALPKITAVMTVTEALRFKHPNLGMNAWLQQFKQAFLEAEDVLDELKYRELEDTVKNQDQVSSTRPSSLILGSLKRKFPGSNIYKDTLGRLREAVQMLDLAARDVGLFYQFVTAIHVNGCCTSKEREACNVSSRETTSFLTERKVFGREHERAKVLGWLKKPASDDHALISVLCIIGAGGLGKTTLAQLILEDIRGENNFGETIWVCVSTSFSVEDITRNILQELGEKTNCSESLNGLQKKLKEKIHSKKVLFILDDVWNDDNMCDWEKLIAPLKFVQEGSKLLVTTRMKSVASMLARVLDINSECLDLRGLEEQELLLLFNKYAFHGYNLDNHKDFQKIGKDIVKKLWGSPLAAKVIGSLLNSNMNIHYWKRILSFDSLINLEQAKNVADVLKLSYYLLSTDVQECFRFCSIFPQNYKFEKNRLIRMWVASGFIRQQLRGYEERPEDIAKEYFNNLLVKSFFEPHPHLKNYYIMHDLIRELAHSVSEGECCRVESNENPVNIPSTTQHVSVQSCDVGRVFHLANLHTLIITKSKNEEVVKTARFVLSNDSLKGKLRLLDIHEESFYHCEVIEWIGRLIHLRYLAIGNRSKILFSHSIYKLYHLQVLDWHGENFETTGITNLVSLRYMMIPYMMMQNIKGVHKLTSLQQLTFYVRRETGQHIDELKTLNNLRNLSIQKIGNVEDPTEARNAELSKKRSLISLELNWYNGTNAHNPEQIFDNLQPHPDLKVLDIKNYEGYRSPIWMKNLPPLDLSSLKLSNCPLWEDLPLLNQMPHLKELVLLKMSEVKELNYSLDITRNGCPFPSLEKLHCMDMPKWESWARPLNYYGFPNLRELTICNCPNLAELPALPLCLCYFEVCTVGLSALPDIYNSSSTTSMAPSSLKSSLRDVRIINCPNFKLMNGFLQQENLDLQALEKLIIHSCENMMQLPTFAFGKFESLKHLSICDCPKLLAVDDKRNLLPVKLDSLRFGNCGELDVQLLESASHLTFLYDISIINSPSISCIPSSENVFQSLGLLWIIGCDKLIEYSSKAYGKGVNPGKTMTSLQINDLQIPHLSLLFIEPFRSLKFVRTCSVKDCSGMEALPEQWLLQNCSNLEKLYIDGATSLRSLPSTMVRLTALRILCIYKANSLEEIPRLPVTLLETIILGVDGRQLV